MSLLEFRGRLHYPSGFDIDAAFETDSPATALYGPSGSGKTTILSMIAGLRTPDEGFIRLGDAVWFDSRSGAAVAPEHRGIGYVFQQHLLFPHLSVRDNLLFGWKRRPGSAAAMNPDRIIEVLALNELLDRKPATLSGGQHQRVALGRALLCAPKLLLLDEPLASVDDDLKANVLGYIEQILHDWRIPTLYVTHNAAEVRRICEWAVRLDAGRIVASGKPDAIL
jgi:molybdate transport system ATP-binding protein